MKLNGSEKHFFGFVSSIVAISILCACGGGGGGGGGGGSVEDGTKRTSGPSIRVLHAALDIEPVDLKVGLDYVARTAFMDVDFMTPVKSGTQDVVLERGNSPGVNYYAAPMNFAPDTEYSLLLSGESSHNNFLVSVLEEPSVRPAEGSARIQLINLLEGSGPLALHGTSVAVGPVPFRLSSGYSDIGVGPQAFTVVNDRGGVLASFTADVADRGEVTIVLGGYTNQGVIVTRIFTDLD